MSTIKISEKKLAILLLLEKINDIFADNVNFGFPLEPRPADAVDCIDPNIIILKKNIHLWGQKYEIEEGVFNSALNYLERCKIIAKHSPLLGVASIHLMPVVREQMEYFESRGISLDNILNKPNTPTKKYIKFDKDRSTLFLQEKEILISKAKNSRPHYILTVIFTNKEKGWNYDEIAENLDKNNPEPYKKDDWKKFYQACRDINEKVAKETTIKNFLDFTKFKVSINKNLVK